MAKTFAQNHLNKKIETEMRQDFPQGNGAEVLLGHDLSDGELISFLLEYEARKLDLEVQRSTPLVATFKDDRAEAIMQRACGKGISRTAYNVTRDKSLTKSIFDKSGIANNRYLSLQPSQFNEALVFARSCDFNVVVKPVHGVRGHGVFTRMDDEASLRSSWKRLQRILRSSAHKSILVEERFIGTDFRFFVVNRRVEAVLERIPANVIGDGDSTIAQLVDSKNALRRKNPDLRNRPVVIDGVALANLQAKDLTIDSIMPLGTRIFLRDNANVSTGGDSVDRTDEIPSSVKKLVVRAVSAVPDLYTCGVDVLAANIYDGERLGPDNIVFIELEGDAAMGMHHFPGYGKPRNIARAILLEHFPHRADRLVEDTDYRHDFGENRASCQNIAEEIVRRRILPVGKKRHKPISAEGPETNTQAVSRETLRHGLCCFSFCDDRSARPSLPQDRGTYTLTFCGDTSLGDYYLSRRRGAQRVYQRLCQAPQLFFAHVKALVGDSDTFIANLETCLVTGMQSPFAGKKKYLGWDDPERTLNVLKAIGVTAANLANNHTMDFGAEGLLSTVTRLGKFGIKAFGAGNNQKAASKPLLRHIKVNGHVKAMYVIGAFETRRAYRERYEYYARASAPGVNPLSQGRLTKKIKRLREADPEAVIIVCPHWHRNYAWAGDAELQLSSTLISAGADLVIGHGSHMLQQCHWSRTGTQLLSLGNFIFNSPGRYAKFMAPPFSLIARLEIRRGMDGWASNLKVYPILTDNLQTDFNVQPVDKAMLRKIYSLLAEHAPDAAGFRSCFDPAEDERGPHIILNRPISHRFVGA